MRARLALLTLMLVALVCSRAALAAETTATIVGMVRDEAGAPVAGGRIVLTSASGHYEVHSDRSGRFTLAAVTPDTYAVSVDAPNFAHYEQHGVTANPGSTVRLDLRLAPTLRVIGSVTANTRSAFTVGSPQDSFTVSGAQARGPTSASASGLASYTRGTVQSAVATVPGVQQDQFANVILRAGKVDDVVFSYDAVPVPQAIIAEPGGNVIGAQLPTTSLGYTTVTTAGFANASDNALAGLIDEVPEVGVYPARTTLTAGLGVVGAARDVELQRLWASPSLAQRYAVDASIGSQSIRYGDGHTFYPAEAATYGLSLDSRATWSIAANAHFKVGKRDDLEILGLSGEATYDQYGTPFTGEIYGAFGYPSQPMPASQVMTPTRIRGTYAIEKVQLLRSYEHSYARARIYRSQYGSATNAPFFDDLSFPNGVISYRGSQSGVLTGFGLDVKSLASARHQLGYGAELRRQTSTLAQTVTPYGFVPANPADFATSAELLSSNPVLTSALAYLSDEWSPSEAFTLQAALRWGSTHVHRSDGTPSYDVAALDPHLSAVLHLRGSAVRLAYDHVTVPPKPLQAERFSSTNAGAPVIDLSPERGDSYDLSFERGGAGNRLRLSLFSKDERDRIDTIPTNFRNSVPSGSNPGTVFGIPQNVGSLLANGIELAADRGPLSLSATYVHARSSSASQFGLNNLNAPAIAANHLFPVGYVPDLTAIATYRFRAGRVTIAPSLSYETGYPYGNGRKAWIYDPNTGKPVQVLNDNHVNPGASYYFLRDPSLAYDPATNPIVSSLGTPEGDDPNTLRSNPLLLASLHIEAPLSKRVTLALDVANLFGTTTPTQLQGNPYMIGPPGYTGGNAAYAAWFGQQLGGGSYTLGNGVPTNNGTTPVLPWQYGTGPYVPASYPEARSVYLRLIVNL
jgi:hypothetical protein